MKTQNCKINIQGMHCRSCELKIEDELLKVKGIDKANANHSDSTVTISYQGLFKKKQIAQAIKNAGYELSDETVTSSGKWFKADLSKVISLAIILGLILFISELSKGFGFFNLSFNLANNSMSWLLALMVGVTAGLSTCMALIGGLVLAVSAKFAQQHPEATVQEKLAPPLMFNVGRVLGFFLGGGLLGLVGSVIQLSVAATGWLTLFIGLLMLILGIQLIDVFPWLTNFKLTLPKQLSRKLHLTQQDDIYSHTKTALLGALSFLLPCGFTQAIQLNAINSGSFISGSILMGMFAIGTAVGLMAAGSMVSLAKGKLSQIFFMAIGLVVIVSAVSNILRGLNLLGTTISEFKVGQQSGAILGFSKFESKEQIIRMEQNRTGYVPNFFTVKKNQSVTWIINSVDSYSCASSLVIPKLNIQKFLNAGENIITFTPTQVGQIKFSCGMGMYEGTINVTD